MNRKSIYTFWWNYNGEQMKMEIQAETLKIAEQLLYQTCGISDYEDVSQPSK